jgi:hypothetical protein
MLLAGTPWNSFSKQVHIENDKKKWVVSIAKRMHAEKN